MEMNMGLFENSLPTLDFSVEDDMGDTEEGVVARSDLARVQPKASDQLIYCKGSPAYDW